MDVIVTINEFKHQLKDLGYAESSIVIYRRGLDQFSRYLAARTITDLRHVSHQVICEYQVCLTSKKAAMETRAVFTRAVKRMFEHLVASNRLLINPCEGIVETCRKNVKVRGLLTDQDLRKLCDQPDPSYPMQVRDRAIMEVLYSTGIRSGELIRLQVYDVDFKDQTLFIRKGTGAQRTVPVSDQAGSCLRAYLETVRPRYSAKNIKQRKLFLLNNGRAFNMNCFQARINEYRLKAGIQKPVSAHAFRKVFAMRLNAQGTDIDVIKKLLGHRHARTTRKYLNQLRED